MSNNKKLDKWRDDILKFSQINLNTATLNGHFSEKENAGTAILLAAQAIGVAAAALSKAEPHMQNAPVEAQMDNALDLIRETLCKKKPNLTLVRDGNA